MIMKIKRKPFRIPFFKIKRKPHKAPKIPKRILDKDIQKQQKIERISEIMKNQFPLILEDMIRKGRILIASARMNTYRFQLTTDKYKKFANMLCKLYTELTEYAIPLDKFFKFSFLFWSQYDKRANIKEIFDRMLKKEIRQIAMSMVSVEGVEVLDEIYCFLTAYNKEFNPDYTMYLKIDYDVEKLPKIIHHFEMFDKLNLNDLGEYFRIWQKWLEKHHKYVDIEKTKTTFGFILSPKIVPTEKQLREFLKTTSLTPKMVKNGEIKNFRDLIQHFGFRFNVRFSTAGYKNEYKFPRVFNPLHNIHDIDVLYPDGSYKTCGKFIKNQKKLQDYFYFDMEE